MERATKLIHHSGARCKHTGAVNFPIYEVSTFKQEGIGVNRGYDYSRSKNPTRDVLEDYIASLESVSYGYAFSSGMAAISACLMTLGAGAHIIATQGLYGGTYRLLKTVFEDLDVSCSFVDTSDLDALAGAFQEDTRAVVLETPANPLMTISDIAEVARIAHAKGALVFVDNTFMSPWLQRPCEEGADVVIHSATKFLGGHSDVIAGLAATNDKKLASRIYHIQNAVGAVPSPFDVWLLMRGMKTLGIRMNEGQANASRIADWLVGRDEVEQVLYPGGKDFPGNAIHRRQADGPGAILSFTVRDDIAVDAFVEHLSIWTLAVSLGAVESIVTVPAKMTHLSYPREELRRVGLPDNLVRLSVGIEDARDLIGDLENAFEACRK